MKTIPAALVSVMLIFITITPVFAADPVVLQNDGGASPSMILGLWEQDLSGVLETGDSIHSVEGIQFLPPCNEGERKTIQIYAIVTDTGDSAVLKAVNAEIQQSSGSYQKSIPLMQTSSTDGIWSAENGRAANVIRYTESFSSEAVMKKLIDGTASVWKGEVILPSTQSAGLFTVTVTGTDTNEKYSPSLKNSFTYLPLACIEYDFSTLNYGEVGMRTEKWVLGDVNFGTGNKPTVRNTGNIPARIRVIQDDMAFGQDLQGGWNVRYQARMGTAGNTLQYPPCDEVLISDVVDQGEIHAMDFSITVIKGNGFHTGSMTLGYDSLPSEPAGDNEISEVAVPEFPGLKEFLDTVIQIIDLD